MAEIHRGPGRTWATRWECLTFLESNQGLWDGGGGCFSVVVVTMVVMVMVMMVMVVMVMIVMVVMVMVVMVMV